MRILKTEVYEFSELSPEAKEKAREWYRNGALDYEWWDCIYEDAKTVGALMGIEVEKIYFSGFWSQGDGACFEGRYVYKKGSVKAVKEYAPVDETLHRIVRDLQKVQRRYFYRLSANVKHSGHYYHEYCTAISVYSDGDVGSNYIDFNLKNEDEEAVKDSLRDFMRWIYRQLEKEYDYQMSDEVVDETIEANEYEFTKAGKRA